MDEYQTGKDVNSRESEREGQLNSRVQNKTGTRNNGTVEHGTEFGSIEWLCSNHSKNIFSKP